ncbi:MAG TPA: DNA polymerase III subunit delta [Actinomycetota bacterium]|jgi:DNA polymerase-3 subunit delta|nr:DNA polymerase III subunit delta [Actinomycetota bacterium]
MTGITEAVPAANLAAYLILGEDEYLIGQTVSKLLEGVGESSISEFGPGDEFPMVLQALMTPPMFEDRRFVVVKEVDRLPVEALRQLIGFLDNPTPATTMVLVASKAPPSMVSAVKKAGRVIEAVRGKRPDLFAWLKQQFNAKHLSVTGEGLTALIDSVGEERMALAQAVEELSLAIPARTRIGRSEIAQHFRGRADVKLYAFVDAVAQRHASAALEALHYLLVRGEAPQMLFWTLARHFRMLLVASDASAGAVADMLRLPMWRAEKLVRQARGFGGQALVAAYQTLAAADLKMKRSEEPEALTLERAVVAIASPR